MPRLPVAKSAPKMKSPDTNPLADLINCDPDRKYVYVDPNNDIVGVAFYEALGAVVETKREGGPRPRVGKTLGDGDAVTVLGQILMSYPKERHEEIVQQGEWGAGGQSYVDKLESKITKPGGVDGFRGYGYAEVINKTQ